MRFRKTVLATEWRLFGGVKRRGREASQETIKTVQVNEARIPMAMEQGSLGESKGWTEQNWRVREQKRLKMTENGFLACAAVNKGIQKVNSLW